MDNPRLPPFWGQERLWQLRAACRDADPSLFFAAEREGGGGTAGERERQRAAKAICARCLVLARCRALVDLLEAEESPSRWHGVWAAETPAERRRRRQSARP